MVSGYRRSYTNGRDRAKRLSTDENTNNISLLNYDLGDSISRSDNILIFKNKTQTSPKTQTHSSFDIIHQQRSKTLYKSFKLAICSIAPLLIKLLGGRKYFLIAGNITCSCLLCSDDTLSTLGSGLG